MSKREADPPWRSWTVWGVVLSVVVGFIGRYFGVPDTELELVRGALLGAVAVRHGRKGLATRARERQSAAG